MGHRVAILKEGGFLQQVDTPRNLYDRPDNAFVAGFIGSPAMNLRTAKLTEVGARLGNIELPLTLEVFSAAKAASLSEITLGVRPESFRATRPDSSGPGTGLQVYVKLVEELGADAYVYGTLEDDAETDKNYVVRFDGRVPPRIGDTVSVDVHPGEEHAFHPETGERLG